MTTELSSAKYFNPELTASLGLNDPEGNSQVPVTGHSIADPSKPVNAYATPGHVPAQKASPMFVTVIACFLALAGIVGVLGGAFGAVGQAAIASMDTSQMAQAMGGSGQAQQFETYSRTVATLKNFSLVIYLHNGICALVGAGFLASCFFLLTHRPEANSFASTACFAAIFYNCLTVVVTWVTFPSLEGMSGMPDGAAAMAMTIAIGVTAFVAMFKICCYGFMIFYLSKPNVKAVFQPVVPEAAIA